MKKELWIDRALRNLIDKHLTRIVLVLMVFFALIIRFIFAQETLLSPDYETYYRPWVEYYRENGIFKGLGNAIGDYYVPLNVMYALSSVFPTEPYVPLVLVSTACEFISAYFIYKIFFLLTGRKNHSVFAGAATLFLPFVAFNGALWKQVDSIYTCVIIVSVYMLLKQRYRAAIIWYSVAFAIKLQSVFFLPIFVILYITGGYKTYDRVVKDAAGRPSFSFLEFMWIPVIYLIAGLPEVILGNGLRATYLQYFVQSGEMQSEGYGMVSYIPNLYNLGLDNYDDILSGAALLLLFVVLMIIAVFCYRKRDNIDRNLVVYLTIWTAWTCVILMPGMHERYDYAILLLLTPFAVLMRKQIIWPMFAANICSLAVYGYTLFHAEAIINILLVSVVYVAAYLYTTIDILRLLNGEVRKEI